MDVAASEFWKADINKYDLGKNWPLISFEPSILDFKNSEAGDLADKSRYVSPTELADIYCDFIKNYPIVSIEDPFDQDDWEGYVHFTERVGTETQVVGDDLLVTNPTRIQTGIDKKACNALLLKVNQIGTLTESIQAAKMSLKEGWGVMVSHRSGMIRHTHDDKRLPRYDLLDFLRGRVRNSDFCPCDATF